MQWVNSFQVTTSFAALYLFPPTPLLWHPVQTRGGSACLWSIWWVVWGLLHKRPCIFADSVLYEKQHCWLCKRVFNRLLTICWGWRPSASLLSSPSYEPQGILLFCFWEKKNIEKKNIPLKTCSYFGKSQLQPLFPYTCSSVDMEKLGLGTHCRLHVWRISWPKSHWLLFLSICHHYFYHLAAAHFRGSSPSEKEDPFVCATTSLCLL